MSSSISVSSSSKRKRADATPSMETSSSSSSSADHVVWRDTPLFLAKAFTMINECSNDVACWSDDGSRFFVKDKVKLANEYIPKYFDSKIYSSFERQLNFYSFQKLSSPDRRRKGGTKTVGFQHANFHRDHPERVCYIQRTTSNTKGGGQHDREAKRLRQQVTEMEERIRDMSAMMEQRIVTLKAQFDQQIDVLKSGLSCQEQVSLTAETTFSSASNGGNEIAPYIHLKKEDGPTQTSHPTLMTCHESLYEAGILENIEPEILSVVSDDDPLLCNDLNLDFCDFDLLVHC